MINMTIAWMALPFFVGFLIYLLPKLDRLLALGMALVSAAYAALVFLEPSPLEMNAANLSQNTYLKQLSF